MKEMVPENNVDKRKYNVYTLIGLQSDFFSRWKFLPYNNFGSKANVGYLTQGRYDPVQYWVADLALDEMYRDGLLI